MLLPLSRYLCFIGLLSLFSISGYTSGIEQITVTGTRSESVLAEVTGNLSVIDQSQIEQVGAQHVNQIMARVPGAWISRGNGQEHLTAIRSPVLTGAGGCGAFLMAQDGISVRAPGFCNTNQLFDINTEQAGSIEVLRGPASVLYGSNAVHGVINVRTPDIEQLPPLRLSLEHGADDYLRTKLNIVTQTQKHSFAVFGNATSDGGYKDDSGFDQQKLSLVHQFGDEQLSIKNVISGSNLNQETAGFIQGFESYREPQLRRVNPNPEAFRDNQSIRAYSQITWSKQENSSLTVTPFFRWSNMTFLQHFLPWQSLEQNSQRSVGVQAQFEKQIANVQLLSGFDLDLTRGTLKETQDKPFAPTIPEGVHYDYEVDAAVYSPFFSVNYTGIENLNLTFGGRFDKTTYDYTTLIPPGSACEPEVQNCRFTRPEDQKVEFEEWSWQTGFNYSIGSDNRLYGKYANGYRAPQATELFRLQAGQAIANLQPETIKSIELGWRTSFEHGNLDLTLFDMRKDNFIFQDSQRQNISGGSTEHYGIEVSGYYSLSDSWYSRLNATLAKHRYISNINLSNVAIAGNEIDTAPEHMASAQLGWREDRHWLEFEWVHQGNYFLDPANTASYRGHNLFHLRAGFALSEQLTFGLKLLNLTNVDYAERADFAFGNYRYFVGEPRSVFVSLTYQMN